MCLAAAAPAAAKSYTAERFDAVIRVLPDGTLDVTETIVFRFEDGAFSEVFREIQTRRTDGVEIVRAELQGVRLPEGREPGTVEIRQRDRRVRVLWRFRPIERATRQFVLNYQVRGVVRQEEGADVLSWRATPSQHKYAVEGSSIRFDLPASPSQPPSVTVRKAGTPRTTTGGRTVAIETSAIRENGWVEAELRFPRGAVIGAPPAWQQHAADVARRAPLWMVAGGLVAALGFIVLFAWRQGYDAPARELTQGAESEPHPPDEATAAVAGTLAANGRAGVEQAMAVLFALAEGGAVSVSEIPRSPLGQRDFQVTRTRRTAVVRAPHEEAALSAMFTDRVGEADSVKLSKARSRMQRRLSGFSRAMREDLRRAGLIDDARAAIRHRYNTAAICLAAAGIVCVAPAALLLPRHGAWAMLVPAAILVVALGAALFAAATTPLSNLGVRRAHRWRGYGKHLREVAEGRVEPPRNTAATTLPFVIALGIGGAWAKFLKDRPHALPGWFHALQDSSDRGAFPALIISGGAGGTATGGAGAGGFAGGGASGAR